VRCAWLVTHSDVSCMSIVPHVYIVGLVLSVIQFFFAPFLSPYI
jgi:hypothetical protein